MRPLSFVASLLQTPPPVPRRGRRCPAGAHTVTVCFADCAMGTRSGVGAAELIWTPPVWQAGFGSSGSAGSLRSYIRPVHLQTEVRGWP